MSSHQIKNFRLLIFQTKLSVLAFPCKQEWIELEAHACKLQFSEVEIQQTY